MKTLIIFFFPFLAFAGVNDGSIMLLNDTAFILTATIQASDGSYLGQFSIQPGQQRNFTQNLYPTGYTRPGTPDISLTPYTVIWQCASDELFSTVGTVGAGSLVRATDGQGPRMCRPKVKPPQETPASTLKKTK